MRFNTLQPSVEMQRPFYILIRHNVKFCSMQKQMHHKLNSILYTFPFLLYINLRVPLRKPDALLPLSRTSLQSLDLLIAVKDIFFSLGCYWSSALFFRSKTQPQLSNYKICRSALSLKNFKRYKQWDRNAALRVLRAVCGGARRQSQGWGQLELWFSKTKG